MEATVVCVDNGEWTRNGDFTPTRFEAQQDAINLLAGVKTEANAENTVGVITMAGDSPQVVVTPTMDLGRVLSAMSTVVVKGEPNVSASLQVAQLALKHRQNKNQRQRVVLFIGSPLKESEVPSGNLQADLVKLGKKLKKNNVAVDVVVFGGETDLNSNVPKLEAFHQAVDAANSSAIVQVPAGANLADVLISSPVFQGEGAAAYGGAGVEGVGREAYQFGVDPNVDPDLALALQVSLEEERARQSAAAQAAQGAGEAQTGGGGAAEAGAPPPAAGVQATPDFAPGDVEMADAADEDELLQQALAMSISAMGEGGADTEGGGAAAHGAQQPPAGTEAAGEDDELTLALQMSMAEDQADKEGDDADKQ